MNAVVMPNAKVPAPGTTKRKVLDVILGLQRNGRRDATNKEIQDAYERLYSCRVGEGTISGTVNRLLEEGFLLRSPGKRQCASTRYEHATATYIPVNIERAL